MNVDEPGSSPGDPAPGQPGAGQLAAAVRRVLPSVRRDLERLVRIPSVSADPAAGPMNSGIDSE